MSDQQNKLINRPPRIQPDLPQEEVEIPPPPVEDQQGQPLIQTFLPLITIIGYVIVLAGWLLIDTGLKALLNEGTYGVWNQVQCVEQPKPDSNEYVPTPVEITRGFNTSNRLSLIHI